VERVERSDHRILVTVRAPRYTRCGWPQRESRPSAESILRLKVEYSNIYTIATIYINTLNKVNSNYKL